MEEIMKLAIKVSKYIEPKKDCIVYIKNNDRDGYYLSTTSKRSQALIKAWPHHPFKIRKQTSTAKLFSEELTKLSNEKILIVKNSNLK